jgi:hypothetical protein
MLMRIDQSGHRLDQAGSAVVECPELQLATLDFSEASGGATRERRSPPNRLPIELVQRWIDEEQVKP